MKRNIPAYIVMPKNYPKVKIAVEGYNATITLCEPTLKARRETLEKIATKKLEHMLYILSMEPFQSNCSMRTSAMEMIEDIGDLDAPQYLLEVVDYQVRNLHCCKKYATKCPIILELNQKVPFNAYQFNH